MMSTNGDANYIEQRTADELRNESWELKTDDLGALVDRLLKRLSCESAFCDVDPLSSTLRRLRDVMDRCLHPDYHNPTNKDDLTIDTEGSQEADVILEKTTMNIGLEITGEDTTQSSGVRTPQVIVSEPPGEQQADMGNNNTKITLGSSLQFTDRLNSFMTHDEPYVAKDGLVQRTRIVDESMVQPTLSKSPWKAVDEELVEILQNSLCDVEPEVHR